MAIYSINEIIEMAVQIERNGYAFYQEATKRRDLDEKSLELLTLLRDQELNHEKIFLNLRDDTDMMNLDLSQDWEMVAAYMKSIVDGRIFNDKDSAIRRATEAKDILSLVEFAIYFEKDTLLYFHAISDSINNAKALMVLRHIINEEISHVLRLSEYKKSLI